MHKKGVIMIVVVVLLFLIVFGFKYKQESTEVFGVSRSGVIQGNEVWSKTIYITGDTIVPKGITVIIKPGTKILIKANYDDQNEGGNHIIDEVTYNDPTSSTEYTSMHAHFFIHGKLIAVGTPEEKIIFTSDSEDPKHTDWDGITFESTSSGEMKYCIIEWAHTGPAIHRTNKVNISYCEIKHIFWGGLHAFESSPTFEYNLLDDIGHEAFDTHKASPMIRFNNISHARTGAVFNYYDLSTQKPLIFENNIIENSGNLAALQENAKVIIRNNKFIGSKDTGGPWQYKGFTLFSEEYSNGFLLTDNVGVEITNNIFVGIENAISYKRIGPNAGVGHTTNIPEPFEIGENPIRILIKNNYFDDLRTEKQLEEIEEKWENVELINNSFGDSEQSFP